MNLQLVGKQVVFKTPMKHKNKYGFGRYVVLDPF